MAKCGIGRIDQMFAGVAALAPIAAGDPDKACVAAVQDLLRGHDAAGMPDPRRSDYGVFGARTKQAVEDFRARNGLAAGDTVDSSMVQSLVRTRASAPVASRPYLALALDLEWSRMLKIMAVTTLLEGCGKFAAINANTDGAGLSFGIIQWAQKPGRLVEVLRAMRDADAPGFTAVFGNGDAPVAGGLITHTARPNGGVDAGGNTIDPKYDLVAETWLARFRAAALAPAFQKAQVGLAKTAFEKSFQQLQGYAPDFVSERAVAFALDIANQHGDGGAKAIYTATKKPGQSLADHVEAMVEESVRRVKPQFQDGTRARRRLFLDTDLLSGDDFQQASVTNV